MSFTASTTSTSAIQRSLFNATRVHIYAVPPLTSNKGYVAAQWTVNPPIFSASLRVIETASPNVTSATRSAPTPSSKRFGTSEESITVIISLEDPSSGELFAEAPYTHPTVVTPCTDSVRFFALRVVGDGGKKATLGLGFEERSDAFDFRVALEEAVKILGLGANPPTSGAAASVNNRDGKIPSADAPRKDYSLKEGEMIKVNIGKRNGPDDSKPQSAGGGVKLFDSNGALLPPPSAAEVKGKTRAKNIDVSGTLAHELSQEAEDQGFDDAEFGEFQ